jgi:hypothetical protein
MRNSYFLIVIGLLLSLRAWAQGVQSIAGTVQTEAGMPLPGATVFIKDTYKGNSTNEEGQFEIKADFSQAR